MGTGGPPLAGGFFDMLRFVFSILFIAFCSTPVLAATLSFDSYESGENGNKLELGAANMRLLKGANAFVYQTGDFGVGTGGGFCAVTSDFTCKGKAQIVFKLPVENLRFRSYFAGYGDKTLIKVFREGKRVVTLNMRRDGRIDLTKMRNINRLVFVDKSKPGGTGMAFGSFGFRVVEPEVVPLPGSLLFMATVLALTCFIPGRRRTGQ